MRRVAVIGVGVTKFGKHDRTSAELFAEAAAEAIRDADLAPSAIQALYYGNVTGGEGERQLHMGPLAATLLVLPTIPTTRFENACAIRPCSERISSALPPPTSIISTRWSGWGQRLWTPRWIRRASS